MTSPYSGVTDLMLGDLPIPVSVDKQQYVDDAADEIDSIIGVRYETPVDVTNTSVVKRHARLFIERAANFIASGRILLALDTAGEDDNLHAYGFYLVQEATKALQAIANGDYDLTGAPSNDPSGTERPRGAKISNVDASSGVEAFYDRYITSNPPWYLPPPIDTLQPGWAPGGGE